MRVFVTGATGFIGSEIVKELLGTGHKVLGLARSDASAELLADIGVDIHRGDLEDLASLRAGAAACDGVIHTAFIHDFSRFKEVCETDRTVIEAIGSVLAGSDRPFIVTSGTALVSPDHLATEDIIPEGAVHSHPRIASEEAADAVAAMGVRVSVMRLSPSVHGNGDKGFVPMLIDAARQKGVSAYVGDGSNCWNAVHKLDAARAYRLALEKAVKGARYHAVADERIEFKKIAEIIGKHLDIPVVSKSQEEAGEHFGWFAGFAGLDSPASSKLTQAQLGWAPTHPSLLEDMEYGTYFTQK